MQTWCREARCPPEGGPSILRGSPSTTAGSSCGRPCGHRTPAPSRTVPPVPWPNRPLGMKSPPTRVRP
eukprot:1181541-Prymnesium_polylepis.1